MTSVRAALLMVILAPAAVSFPVRAAAPSPPPVAEPAEEGEKDTAESEGGERKADRMKWFYEQRLGPDRTIPVRARERALAQIADHLRFGTLEKGPSSLIAGDGWTSIGPTPLHDGVGTFSGRITTIALHPTNVDTAYIGAAQGGVWKTLDNGVTWTPLTDTQASLAIGSIAIDPSNPNVVYAGTGEPNLSCDSYFGAGILKSIDGGTTWTRIGVTPFANTSISKIIVHPTNSNILWAANTVGSGGFSCYGTNMPVQIGVWKSVDAGLTWTRVLSSAQTTTIAYTFDMVIDPSNANTLYAAVYYSGIWKTTDGGSNWTRLATGLPAIGTIGRGAIGIHPTAPATLYAVFEDYNTGAQYGTYRTTTGGSSWTAVTKPTGSCQYWTFQDICTYTGGASSQCWYNLVISVAPDGSVWIGGQGLWRSTNGGSVWIPRCPNYVHVDQHAIAFQGSEIWLGNDGGVFTSTNVGTNWTSRNQGLTLTQFYPGAALHPTNPAVALGGAQDNGMLSYSGIPGWSQLGTGDGAFNAFDQSNPDSVFYASIQNLGIYKYNGGSWSTATSGLTDSGTGNTSFISPFAMCPSNSQILVAGSNNVWRTTNGAASWSANSPDPLDTISPGAVTTAIAFSPATGGCSTYFAGNNWGRMYRTTDDGASWMDITEGLAGRAISDIAVDPGNASVVVVGISGFGVRHVYRTDNALDAAPTWTAIDSGIPDAPVNAVLFDPDDSNVLYIGTDVGIFRSTNGGTSWQTFMGGHPNVAVFDLVANSATGTIHSYTHGRGVFKLGTFCNDQNACTADSYGQLEGCVHIPVVCEDDSNPCTNDLCDPGTGVCSNSAAPDGTGCSDIDACTKSELCVSGACVGSSVVTCTPLDACHVAGTCDSQTGACSNPAAPDGTSCTDSDACTQSDACSSGACVGSTPVTCTALDACHVAGTCDSQSGGCSNPSAPDGTGCEDGNACTTDSCSGGTCVGSPIPGPGEVDSSLRLMGGPATSITWTATPGASLYDLLTGTLAGLPVGPGGGDESCVQDLASPTATDSTLPAAGTGLWYLVRAENACGLGPLGFERRNGAPTPRSSTTCP